MGAVNSDFIPYDYFVFSFSIMTHPPKFQLEIRTYEFCL